MMSEMTISVRELASFCYRSGDIDYRFRPSPTGLQGIEGHQRVYRSRPDSYLREYSVQYQASKDLLLKGRADGYDPSTGVVEEIKTCRVNPASIPEPISRLHMSQARLYAAMIAASESRQQLHVRLTWFNIDDETETSLEQSYTGDELQVFLDESLSRFSEWLARVLALRQARDSSLAELAFPHRSFRSGQRDIAELVYKCIDQEGQLMIEAPTGIGKTAAVLFPALKALARDKHDRIVFLTAKSVGRRTAEETLNLFAGAGYRGTALSLTAKEKICLSPGKACHGDACPYARDYYDKLPDAMLEAIERPLLDRQALEQLAERFEVCPYQLSLDLLPWIDIVIGDLHHLFGLPAMLDTYIGSDGRRWTALIDEAHNLPGRARGMYRAELSKKDLMAARSVSTASVRKGLDRVNRAMLALQKGDWGEEHFHSVSEVPAELLEALSRLVADCGDQQADDATYLHRQPALLDFYFSVLHFLRVADCWGDEFRCEFTKGAHKQSLRLALNCLDPSRLLGLKQNSLHSVTAFSATLTPASWVRSALGLGEKTVFRREESPFAADQLTVTLATHVDTRYRARQQSLGELVELISRWLTEVPGNCIVYFPSYRYMRDALSEMTGKEGVPESRNLWVQEPAQGDIARAELLQTLESSRNLAAFCILGGVFGEGIDLPGEQLSSVVIVGVGLPQVNRDTECLRGYFSARYGRGFEYAYLYPGMQKVDQALGRVVRRLEDRGRALLIDRRYASEEYRQLLPPWWTYEPLPDA